MFSLTDTLWSLYHWLLRWVDPAHPVALALRAEEALGRKEWGTAFDLSNLALKKRLDFSPAYFVRGLARLQLDDYGGALHDLNRFLSLVEEPPTLVYYWRARIYAQKGEWTLALADFDRVLASTPDDPQLHYWRAYLFWQRQEWERMRESLARLEALSGENLLTWELRGHLLLHEERYEEAERAYSQALARGGESPDLLYNRALARRQRGHHEAARRDLERILSLDRHNPWVHLELSNFAFALGDYDYSLHHAQAALALEPTLVEARISEAATLIALEQPVEARVCLEALHEEYPEEPLVAQLYGDVLAELGEGQAAIECYHAALLYEPENHTLQLRLAGELINRGRYAEAEALIEEVLEAEPHHEEAHATRADLYRYTNRPDAMRDDLDFLLILDPSNAWALTFRAAHRQWQGDEAGALADYSAALTADSSEAWIWAFRGQFYMRQRQYAAARNDFQQAITLDPEDPWIRRQWAALLHRSGQSERAAEILDCLTDDFPSDGHAFLFRAELHLAAGAWDDACLALQRIVAAEHELAWLAHAILAAFAEDSARAEYLALAERLRPAPTFWGVTPATVLAQQSLLSWLNGREQEAETTLRAALAALEPGEQPWCGLRPLFAYLEALPLLRILDEKEAAPLLKE